MFRMCPHLDKRIEYVLDYLEKYEPEQLLPVAALLYWLSKTGEWDTYFTNVQLERYLMELGLLEPWQDGPSPIPYDEATEIANRIKEAVFKGIPYENDNKLVAHILFTKLLERKPKLKDYEYRLSHYDHVRTGNRVWYVVVKDKWTGKEREYEFVD